MPKNNASNGARTPSIDELWCSDYSIKWLSKIDTTNAVMLNQPTPHSKESLAISSLAENGI